MVIRQGFSLIELLVVMFILGILSAISYPLYTSHLIQTRRAQAKVILFNLATQLEHHYLLHGNYKDVNLSEMNNKEKKYYRFEITSATDKSFNIQAMPLGSQRKDDQCNTLTYNHLGEKGITGNGEITECW